MTRVAVPKPESVDDPLTAGFAKAEDKAHATHF